MKAYSPNNLVKADDVRAMIGVLSGAQNVSKGIITTTSDFAPKITEDKFIKPFLPHRIELRSRDVILPWLNDLQKK